MVLQLCWSDTTASSCTLLLLLTLTRHPCSLSETRTLEGSTREGGILFSGALTGHKPTRSLIQTGKLDESGLQLQPPELLAIPLLDCWDRCCKYCSASPGQGRLTQVHEQGFFWSCRKHQAELKGVTRQGVSWACFWGWRFCGTTWGEGIQPSQCTVKVLSFSSNNWLPENSYPSQTPFGGSAYSTYEGMLICLWTSWRNVWE